MIGIVGGVGPYAGIDIVKKIFDLTKASCDQEHLPVALLSLPHLISDRTGFLLGKTAINPGIAIAEIICRLEKCGASVVGIPCNTAHAPLIFNEILKGIPASVKLLHIINEVAEYIKRKYASVKNVGVLSTTGAFKTSLFPKTLSPFGFNVIQVPGEIQEEYVQPAIYSKDYGIKSHSNPVSGKARGNLLTGIDHLLKDGAELIILGCTEIPLAFMENNIKSVDLIDPSQILAKALIRDFSALTTNFL
jgi:aspartate racemase